MRCIVVFGELIVVALLCAPVCAQSPRPASTVMAGGVQLSMPVVVGFRVPEGDERDVMNFVRISVPTQHRLLALFLSEGDFMRFADGELPRLEQYFVAQIPKRTETMQLTISDFQSVRRSMKDDHSMAMRAHTVSQRQFAGALERGGTANLEAVSALREAEPLPLGIFEDREHAVGVHFLTRERSDAPNAMVGRTVLTASVATVLRSRLVVLDAACVIRTADDILQCRRRMKEWVGMLHSANR